MSSTYQRAIGEIAAENPSAARVFERFGIDYSCHAQRPLADACCEAGISVDDVATALAGSAPAPAAAFDWHRTTLTEMHAYIVATFHVHGRAELEGLRALSAEVVERDGPAHPELRKVQRLVHALEQDMIPHMVKEEVVLFPFVDQLESEDEPGASCFGTVRNPIRVMLMEHDGVGAILAELREVTAGYVTSADASFGCRQLYRRLEAFEAETLEHIRIENDIYFPRAIELERRVVT